MFKTLENGEDLDLSSIKNILEDDKNLIKETKDDQYQTDAQRIRKYLKGRHIQILPEYREESGDDWNNDRQSLGFNVMVNNGGIKLPEILSEMNEKAGLYTVFNVVDDNEV